MHVCLVAHEYPPEPHGGIGTQTWNKAQGLTKLGHSVDVVACGGTDQTEPLRVRRECGVSVHRLRRPDRNPDAPVAIYDQASYMVGYTWLILQYLQQLVSSKTFDLINFPEYGAEGFAFQLNRAPDNWIPTIVQLHAPLAMLADRIGWPDKDTNFYRTATYLEGESIRMADAWMASSANIADYVSGRYQIPRQEIDVVHCGVDCAVFRPLGPDERRGIRPNVLFVGHVNPSKGVGTVFEAVMQLRQRFPDILLRVVGRGDEYWPILLKRARELGAEGNVERMPFISDRKAMADMYQQADVFASPADNENGVANVYIEAMASGCPVIAGNTGGASEAVVDGKTGILVTPGDVGATRAALHSILGDATVWNDMSQAARRRAEEYFHQDKYIQRVLAAYQKAIEQSQEKLQRMIAERGW